MEPSQLRTATIYLLDRVERPLTPVGNTSDPTELVGENAACQRPHRKPISGFRFMRRARVGL